MKQILVDMPVHEASLARLRAIDGVAVRIVDAAEEVRPLPDDTIRDINYLFCTFPPANQELMSELEFVQISSVGYVQLWDLDYVKRGVRASNARGVFDPPIAEWNMAMMVNLARDVRGMI